MIRAVRVIPSTDGAHSATADTVVLDYDQRHRRRVVMRSEAGVEFLLDLPAAVALRGGDGLVLDDGRVVAVRAAREPLAEISAAGDGLLRLAWHIGNRHLPAQLLGDLIRIRRDHVIEDMVRGLGGRVLHVSAPFDPESGAYSHAGHAHSHEPGGHEHADPAHDPGHAHGDGEPAPDQRHGHRHG